jgi:hypothetical protein
MTATTTDGGNANTAMLICGEKFFNLFNDTTELVRATELKVFMESPFIPNRCLCGCSHIYDFTTEAQNKNFTSKRTTGKYRMFFSPDHIRTYKRNNPFSK